MSKAYDINLDMDKKNPVKTDIVLCQGDYGMVFRISINDHNLEDVSPTIVFRKTDNKVIEGVPTKVDGALSYEIKGNELSCPGITYADIKLLHENGRESSATFTFKVVGDTLNDTPIESEAYSARLDEAITEALEAAQEARDAAQNGGGGGGGNGNDGFSPVAKVTTVSNGAEIEITDKKGTTKATVLNGAKGDTGTTFTPNVDTEGNLSWTNDKGLPNPEPVNVKGDSADPTVLITPSTDTTSIDKVWSAKDVNDKISKLNTDLGDIDSLDTDSKDSLVSAINEVLSALEELSTQNTAQDTKIGTLSNLTTSNKTSLVLALNELKTQIGTITSLTTTDKTSLVVALNEVSSRLGVLVNNMTNTNQITGFKVLSQVDYDALPSTKTTDGFVYLIRG